MIHRLALIASAAIATFAAPAADAATTVVQGGTRGLQLSVFGPAGQSFVATEQNLLSFGFEFTSVNPTSNDPITLTLRAGAGLTGAVVATRTLTLPDIVPRNNVWQDFNFTGTSLTVNGVYTALLSTTSTKFAVLYGPPLPSTGVAPDAYAGGSLISTRAQTGYCLTGPCDANFRFTTMAAAVPEPATWAMMLVGFAMVGGTVRYRRRGVRLAYR
ncbi:PEPxxWA-CTERM sorting domain-containing protein [Sphingomonas mollis]|nr:PEPxxWA-CTERM sorting domain-containing protein [Sphingomonas sp. BT553]